MEAIRVEDDFQAPQPASPFVPSDETAPSPVEQFVSPTSPVDPFGSQPEQPVPAEFEPPAERLATPINDYAPTPEDTFAAPEQFGTETGDPAPGAPRP